MKQTMVASAYELNELLTKKYGEDLQTDPLRALTGSVAGSFKGAKINITFGKNEYLLISTDSNNANVLEELKPVLREVMGSEEPICSYDLQSEGLEEEQSMPTLEWDIKDPENRIKEVVNGRAFSDGAKLRDLTLYGGRTLENYVEDEKAKEERIANARIYGIDSGSIKDTKPFETMEELDLYFNIDAMGGHIWRCKHDMSHGRIPEIDLIEEQYALEYMVYQTTRFGVELSNPQIDKHITPTASYQAWFRFYDNYFKNELSDEQWRAFQQARKSKSDISEFMPSGNWKDTLEKPATKTLQIN